MESSWAPREFILSEREYTKNLWLLLGRGLLILNVTKDLRSKITPVKEKRKGKMGKKEF